LLCAPSPFQREELEQMLLRRGAEVEKVGVRGKDVCGERGGMV
jgi:hypothetical protein